MRKKLLAAVVTSAALILTAPPPALADTGQQPRVTVVNRTVLAPYSLAVSRGRVYVADGGTSLISRLAHGSLQKVADGPHPGEVAGLAISPNGRYRAFTTTNFVNGATTLEIDGPRGSRVTADLSTYERTVNPDQIISYGVDNPSQCVKDALASQPDGASYPGHIDSHPYAVAAVGRHWVVADAAGNDLLKVSPTGQISTLAVLPRQPLKITAEIAAAQHLPDCVIGVTYNFEAVPTDVEVGRDGSLYVSILAGGPEDPSAGARSKVYRVDQRSGMATQVASGLSGATNLAIAKNGRIFVAELFAGRISVLSKGKPRTYVNLPGALSVEASPDGLWAGTLGPTDDQGNPSGTGSIVHITRSHS